MIRGRHYAHPKVEAATLIGMLPCLTWRESGMDWYTEVKASLGLGKEGYLTVVRFWDKRNSLLQSLALSGVDLIISVEKVDCWCKGYRPNSHEFVHTEWWLIGNSFVSFGNGAEVAVFCTNCRKVLVYRPCSIMASTCAVMRGDGNTSNSSVDVSWGCSTGIVEVKGCYGLGCEDVGTLLPDRCDLEVALVTMS